MARSRQKKLDRIQKIEIALKNPKPQFRFKLAKTSGQMIFETRDLVIGYGRPLSIPLNIKIESNICILSGGEQAKIRLCKLIDKPTNILILDEPTDHLDVDAKYELKRALKEYEGSILLVCHEPEFYKDVVNDVWDCGKWITIS